MIKKIDLYLLSHVFKCTVYVIFVAVGIYALLDTLLQFSDRVSVHHSFFFDLQYLLVRLPIYFYQMMPVSVLIGTVVALFRLVRSNEYVVIRTSGLSLLLIARTLMLFAIAAGLLVAACGEYLVPSSEKISQQFLWTGKAGIGSEQRHNVWLKLDNEVIELWEVLPDLTLKNVLRYGIDDDAQLSYIKFAPRGTYLNNNTWQLHHTSLIKFNDNQVIRSETENEIWKPSISTNVLDILINKPKNMSIRNLYRYIQYLKNNHQKTIAYEIEVWKRIFYPFSMLVMILIALLFTPIVSRYSNEGLKMVLSILLGVTYFFMIRFLSFFIQLWLINPMIAAALPTILFISGLSLLLYYQSRGRIATKL